MFRNLKLGTKLIGGFLAIAALAALVGGVGIIGMRSMAASASAIANDQVPALEGLGNIESGVIDASRIEGDLLAARQAHQAREVDTLQRNFAEVVKAEIDAGWKQYVPLPRSAEEDSAWQQVSTDYATLKQHFDTAITMLAVGDMRRGDALVQEGRTRFRTVKDGLDRLETLQDHYAAQNVQAVHAADSRGRTELGIGIVVALILAIALGVIITRAITRPLLDVVARTEQLRTEAIATLGTAAEAIANGEFDHSVAITIQPLVIATHDEIGDLGNTCNQIIEQSKNTVAAFEKARHTLKNVMADTVALNNAAVAGRLDDRVDASRYAGGYHTLAAGMNQIVDTMATSIAAVNAVLDRAAKRDLTARVTGQFQGAFGVLQSTTNATIENIDAALNDVSVASEQVASASDQISAGSQSLAQGASEQASAIEEVSSSLQEMASMAKQSAANAKEARSLSVGAREGTHAGVDSVKRLGAAMDQIKASSTATAKIVKTIDEIAFQTNLLALNAAVEAARAGDAGKGFAVVAEEVRNLAMRSAEAAKNTASLIEESVRNADQGVAVSVDVGKSLSDIEQRVTKVAEVMEEVTAASEQQTQGIAQINTAVEQMNGVTQQVAANSEESASSSEELSSQADRMRAMVGEFRLTASRSHAAPARPAPAAASASRRPAKPATRRRSATTTAGAAAGRISAVDVEAMLPLHDDGDDDVLGEF